VTEGKRRTRLGVVGNPGYAELPAALSALRELAPGLGLELFMDPVLPAAPGDTRLDDPEQLDALLTLGGDGTLLRGARVLQGHEVPILGVNMGRLGFLTCCPADQLAHSLMRFARGDFAVESRMQLRAAMLNPEGKERESWMALNDVAVHKGGFARVVPLRVMAGDEPIASYSADGVVIATPTGSTAYSLSAGGPVVVPTLEMIIVTPVSPHTLGIRPVVLPPTATISVQSDDVPEELMITVDGQVGTTFRPGETLSVSRAPTYIKIVRFPGSSFFATLGQKLGWGGIPERD